MARFDEPVFTPSPQAETEHDENISFELMIKEVGADVSNELRDR
ncbi:MAG: hypothetical protein GY768_26205 [Planctomycetaceae bacterium]|nr:hypothetical protein [Planctomycetaceae bacterium]